MEHYSLDILDDDWVFHGVTLQYSMAFREILQPSRDGMGITNYWTPFTICDWHGVTFSGEERNGTSLNSLKLFMKDEAPEMSMIWIADVADTSRRYFIEIVTEGIVSIGGDAEFFFSGSVSEDRSRLRSLVECILPFAKIWGEFADAFGETTTAEATASKKLIHNQVRRLDSPQEIAESVASEYIDTLHEILQLG